MMALVLSRRLLAAARDRLPALRPATRGFYGVDVGSYARLPHLGNQIPTKGLHITTNHSAAMALQMGNALSYQPLSFAARPFCDLANQKKSEHAGAQGNEQEDIGKGDEGPQGNKPEETGKGGEGAQVNEGKGCEGNNGTGYRGNWNGYENFLLYQLSETRKELMAENRRLYEQNLGLKKDVQAFHHDTNAKIQRIEAIVSKFAIRILGAIIVLLATGVTFVVPYIKEYVELLLDSKVKKPTAEQPE
ncbi:hypothetical protein ACQJBY_038822 [Aegilops geniculata]